jgi:hypothetical protein
VDDEKIETWGLVYLRDDGERAGRIDYYDTEKKAYWHYDKCVSIHGPHLTGRPRWRVAHFIEA